MVRIPPVVAETGRQVREAWRDPSITGELIRFVGWALVLYIAGWLVAGAILLVAELLD